MTDKARELLERALALLESGLYFSEGRRLLEEEIFAYLAQPEVKREALSEEEINDIYFSKVALGGTYLTAFKFGFREAEKHHGIGGGDE